jgi:predicted DNA-binding transcriptional regulator YafY
MQFGKYQQRMEYLIELIRKERTGPPRELAARLGISERMLYHYLRELSVCERVVVFCRQRRSYIFQTTK